MADILGRTEQVYAGGLTSDASWMFWGGLPNGGLGLLITQMSIQYMQPIRKIFEIGPWVAVAARANIGQPGGGAIRPNTLYSGAPVYYVAGRTEGSLQLGRIAGPVAALGGFYKSYGNICSRLNSLFFVSSSGCIGGLGTGEATPVQGSNQFDGRFAVNRIIGSGRVDPYLGWYMNGVVINTLGLAAQAQDMMVMESVGCQYISLKLYVNENDFNGDTLLNNAVWREL
jgi:hypothetical protein